MFTSTTRCQSCGVISIVLTRLRDAGVVDQDVDLAEGADGLLGGLAAAGEVGDVAADADMARPDVLCGAPRRALGIEVEDGDPRTVFGEELARWRGRCRARWRPRK